jgi:hypothetical protein
VRLIYHVLLILFGIAGYAGLAIIWFSQVIPRGRGSLIGMAWNLGVILVGTALGLLLMALF